MDIKTTPLTLSQLLLGSAEQFVIPPYQRRYSWQRKQIVQLFDDIKYLSEGETHFLGSIVCLTESHTAGVNPLELVDGQQRMTTLILILDTIKDKYEEIGIQREADRMEDLVTCNDIDRNKISKIILGDLDNCDFKLILHQKDPASVKNKKLWEAYQIIKAILDDMSRDELDIFKDKIINRTNIVRLDVSRARDAFKLFEVINNRGLNLSPTDIIKNFLLGHASLINDETLQLVKAEWTKIIINMDGQNLDDFFRQYLCGALGRKVSFTLLADTFKKHYIQNVSQTEMLTEFRELEILDDAFDDKNLSAKKKIPIFEFVKILSNSSKIYADILNKAFDDDKINDQLYDLQRIKSQPSYTFVLNLMQRDIARNDKIKILKLIAIFMLRRNICDYRTSELDDIFSKLTTFEDEKLLNNVKDYLLERMPQDDDFQKNITTSDFYGQFIDRAKCMLETVELGKDYLSENTSEIKLRNDKAVQLEHIIPQTITTKISKNEFGDWEKYLGRDAKELHKEYVHKIGNMTLLSYHLNPIASNNPFKTKQEVYKDSDIKMTKELCRYEDFKFDQVGERSRKLAKSLVEIWRIN